jgi:hypothetical protein
MRMEPRPFEIFRLADRFWRKIIGRVLYREDLASAKFGNKPGKMRRKGPRRRRLDPFDGRRRQNDKRTVILEFSKSAAIEPEKLPEYRLRDLNLKFDPFGRNVGESRGEVREHALERQKFFSRRVAF